MALPEPWSPDWWRQWLAGIETEDVLDLVEAVYAEREPAMQRWQAQQVDAHFAARRQQLKGAKHG